MLGVWGLFLVIGSPKLFALYSKCVFFVLDTYHSLYPDTSMSLEKIHRFQYTKTFLFKKEAAGPGVQR